jgi:peptidoglycan/xylan/chitin deacetylase (PgdA/CDA1 family)
MQILRDLFFNIAYQVGVSKPFRWVLAKNNDLVILTFHRVSDDVDEMWPPMPVASFRSLMEKLVKTFRIIDINKVTKLPDSSGPPFMAVTFDDGYSDFVENAVPILLDLGIPAVQNVCPFLVDRRTPPWTQVLSLCLTALEDKHLKLLDGTNFEITKPVDEKVFLELCDHLYLVDDEARSEWLDNLATTLNVNLDLYSMMTWDDIRSCIKNGLSIGSHSYSHRNLSRVEEPKLLETEIALSRERILDETGMAPSVFSFPNGLYNDKSLQVVEKSGYSIALLCDEKPANIDIINDSDGLLCLPRIDIGRKNWREEALRSSGLHYHLKRTTIPKSKSVR